MPGNSQAVGVRAGAKGSFLGVRSAAERARTQEPPGLTFRLPSDFHLVFVQTPVDFCLLRHYSNSISQEDSGHEAGGRINWIGIDGSPDGGQFVEGWPPSHGVESDGFARRRSGGARRKK